MVTLANEFSRRNIPVDLVLAKVEGPFMDDVSPAVRIVDLKATRLGTALLPLLKYLRHRRPAVVLSCLDYANILAILAWHLALRVGRLVVSERASIVAIHRPEHLLARHMVRLIRLFYPFASHVISVSDGVTDELVRVARLRRDHLTTIYNPVDSDRVRALAILPNEDAERLKSDGAPIVVAVGRLAREKDFETLIRSFALVRALRRARLVILGEGAERPRLERLIKELGLTEDVRLPGFERNPFSWMKAADVFVLSSRREGFCNVLLEAMACGARIVATNCPCGTSEILDNGKWGRLTPVGNVRAMAEAICATLDSRDSPMVETRAREFSVSASADRYLAVLLPDRFAAG